MGTVATDNPVQQVRKCSMYSTRPRKSRTSIACPQPPGWPQPADSDTPPPGVAIAATRRAKNPCQNP